MEHLQPTDRLKVFLFKFHNNILGTGSRVSHFNPTADVACNFCTEAKLLPPPIETFSHIFYDCPIVNKILQRIFSVFFTVPIDREQYFNGNFNILESINQSTTIFLSCIRYNVWQIRLLKAKISYATIEHESLDLIYMLMSCNSKIKNMMLSNTILNIGRHGDGQRNGDGP